MKSFYQNSYSDKGLRMIKTARSKKKINKAAKRGYLPLIKQVIPSKDIHINCHIIQNVETNEIDVIEDIWGHTMWNSPRRF